VRDLIARLSTEDPDAVVLIGYDGVVTVDVGKIEADEGELYPNPVDGSLTTDPYPSDADGHPMYPDPVRAPVVVLWAWER
jgi:hypothetical protein